MYQTEQFRHTKSDMRRSVAKSQSAAAKNAVKQEREQIIAEMWRVIDPSLEGHRKDCCAEIEAMIRARR